MSQDSDPEEAMLSGESDMVLPSGISNAPRSAKPQDERPASLQPPTTFAFGEQENFWQRASYPMGPPNPFQTAQTSSSHTKASAAFNTFAPSPASGSNHKQPKISAAPVQPASKARNAARPKATRPLDPLAINPYEPEPINALQAEKELRLLQKQNSQNEIADNNKEIKELRAELKKALAGKVPLGTGLTPLTFVQKQIAFLNKSHDDFAMTEDPGPDRDARYESLRDKSFSQSMGYQRQIRELIAMLESKGIDVPESSLRYSLAVLAAWPVDLILYGWCSVEQRFIPMTQTRLMFQDLSNDATIIQKSKELASQEVLFKDVVDMQSNTSVSAWLCMTGIREVSGEWTDWKPASGKGIIGDYARALVDLEKCTGTRERGEIRSWVYKVSDAAAVKGFFPLGGEDA